jgi:hypothetical protein
LPPLGQLSSLRDLLVIGFEEVVKVDREFYGSDSLSAMPFGSLKVLRFEQMLKWEEWSSFGDENEGGPFPRLEELYINFCPKLTGELPIHLPSLAKLEILKCPQLVASVPRAPSLRELYLKKCNEVQLKELPTGLQKLKIEGFGALESLPQGLVDSNSCLQELTITKCMKLELPTHLDFSSLETLKLDNCDSLKSFPLDLFPKLYKIIISGCTNLESFIASEQHGRAPNLKDFWVENCGSLRSLPEKMHLLLPSVEYFQIRNCPEIELLPEGGFPSNLELLFVKYCEKLFASRMEWGLQKLSSIRLLCIGSKSEDVVYFPEPGFMPSCLTSLQICGFPNMISLDKKGLQHLTSLQKLWVEDCPKLKYMPKGVLPASLSNIFIDAKEMVASRIM